MQRFLRNSPFGAGGRPVRVFSPPITLEVQPRPDGVGNDWLPAENLELHDSWASEPPEPPPAPPVTPPGIMGSSSEQASAATVCR